MGQRAAEMVSLAVPHQSKHMLTLIISYIVDFEKYDFFDPEQHGVQPWRDDEYDSWNLSEEWLSKFRD